MVVAESPSHTSRQAFPCCTGKLLALRRRSFIGLGLMGGLSALAGFPALASTNTTKRGGHFGRAKNVLVLLEQGGLSHMDTWDPKPEVVAEHRSPYKPIATNVPGIQFTELLKKTARHADKLAVVRSMHHKTNVANGHPQGTQYALSGEMPGGPRDARHRQRRRAHARQPVSLSAALHHGARQS